MSELLGILAIPMIIIGVGVLWCGMVIFYIGYKSILAESFRFTTYREHRAYEAVAYKAYQFPCPSLLWGPLRSRSRSRLR